MLRHNGSVSARGASRTTGRSGSFDVERRTVDAAGTDSFRFRATHDGAVCVARRQPLRRWAYSAHDRSPDAAEPGRPSSWSSGSWRSPRSSSGPGCSPPGPRTRRRCRTPARRPAARPVGRRAGDPARAGRGSARGGGPLRPGRHRAAAGGRRTPHQDLVGRRHDRLLRRRPAYRGAVRPRRGGAGDPRPTAAPTPRCRRSTEPENRYERGGPAAGRGLHAGGDAGRASRCSSRRTSPWRAIEARQSEVIAPFQRITLGRPGAPRGRRDRVAAGAHRRLVTGPRRSVSGCCAARRRPRRPSAGASRATCTTAWSRTSPVRPSRSRRWLRDQYGTDAYDAARRRRVAARLPALAAVAAGGDPPARPHRGDARRRPWTTCAPRSSASGVDGLPARRRPRGRRRSRMPHSCGGSRRRRCATRCGTPARRP